MKILTCICLSIALGVSAHAGTFSITNIAAATTIGVNALETKSTLAKTKKAAKAAKHSIAKVFRRK